jgi:hypothetical protein
MNSSLLVLLGAMDTLIALIQSEREAFGNSFDPEAAVQTLRKVKAEYLKHLLASTRAQLHAGETFRSTLDQLLASLPQGSDLDPMLRHLQHHILTFLPQGPTPPWPSSSSSSSPLGLLLGSNLSQVIAALQRVAGEQAGPQ